MSTLIDLGKLRFTFRGSYSGGSQYEYNDVVLYGGNAYVFVSAAATSGQPPTNTVYWAQLSPGLNSRGAYSAGATYAPNDLVLFGGSAYRCIAATTGSQPPNASYWEAVVDGYNHVGDWAAATQYRVNDAVVHLGRSYRALSNHTATVSFLNDFVTSGLWQRYANGQQSRGAYANATEYFEGDIVSTGTAPNLDLYLCLQDHESSASSITAVGEIGNWQRLIAGGYTTSQQDQEFALAMAVALG